ncbi:putative gtp cyclohydrolase-2 [Phaeomoniella chlamydospora]|uniref:GTP cyclohydrolase II n=1 Tax=Phaeomoniella chlamydospora TaxID=158046 RepID=A0A0G2EHP1_PHACM|nr:putative gtp cyclohydrolase-2 [Phaeomoniella chlamydospora]
MPADLPSHASPVLSPQPRPSAQYLQSFDDLRSSGSSTPGLPGTIISPAFTPPATPGWHTGGTVTPSSSRHPDHEPQSIPVDSTVDPIRSPKLVETLPKVECIVRARIPTVNGTEMFLHLYHNDVDNKEHLAIVFGNKIRSQSLDKPREGETEMDRMIRGAYVGRLRPGRISSRIDTGASSSSTLPPTSSPSISTLDSLDRRKPTPPSALSLTSVPEDSPLPSTTSHPTTSFPAPISTPTTVNPASIPPRPEPSQKSPLIRIHSECYTGETAWSARCDCGEQLDEAARLMSLPSTLSTSKGGVIIYLRQEGRGIGLSEKLKAYNLQDMGADTVEANLLLRHPADARSYGLATAMLLDLGLGGEEGVRLLTNNPDKVRAIEGPNREVRVRERVAMVPLSWKSGGKKGVRGVELEKYLMTKVGRMGHMIEEEEKESKETQQQRPEDGEVPWS